MSDSFVTPWSVAIQVPVSMGFHRQEYWSGLPFPSPEDLPDPGIEPRCLALQSDSTEPPGKPRHNTCLQNNLYYPVQKTYIYEYKIY